MMKYRKTAVQLAMQGFDGPRALDCMEVDDVKINLKDVLPETWKPILKTAIERATWKEGRKGRVAKEGWKRKGRKGRVEKNSRKEQ